MVRKLIRHIIDHVAEGQKCHLQVVFRDHSTHHSTQPGDSDVTIILHNRAAEWRMAFGGMFEFLESYFNGDVDIVGEQGLRRLKGTPDLEVAATLANEGQFLRRHGRLEEARQVLEEALRQALAAGGARHATTLYVRNNLATTLLSGIGFDRVPAKLGVGEEKKAPPNKNPLEDQKDDFLEGLD